MAPTLIKTKSSKCVSECQIDSGALCNVISYSLICNLLQDGNTKLQESKSKPQMYDRSVKILYGIIDIKCEMNQAKTKLQFQEVDTKKDPLISASACLALNLVTLNVNNDQEVNDIIHGIKITKRKTNGDLLSKKKIWRCRIWRCLWQTWLLITVLDNKFRSRSQHSTIKPVTKKIPFANKEKVMEKIDN